MNSNKKAERLVLQENFDTLQNVVCAKAVRPLGFAPASNLTSNSYLPGMTTHILNQF
jgi:hypothetical protein